jgi:hypothetical protein
MSAILQVAVIHAAFPKLACAADYLFPVAAVAFRGHGCGPPSKQFTFLPAKGQYCAFLITLL